MNDVGVHEVDMNVDYEGPIKIEKTSTDSLKSIREKPYPYGTTQIKSGAAT